MQLQYDPRIIKQLGTELITSDEIAIVELIKNAYDAGAKEVRVHFIDSKSALNELDLLVPKNELFNLISKRIATFPCILIEDNGQGMSDNVINDGFLTIGSTYKQELKELQKTGEIPTARMILGEKGLGRLATQRLSDTLYVETAQQNTDCGTFIKLDWSKLMTGQTRIPNLKFHSNKQSYTRLWLIGNNIQIDHLVDKTGLAKPALFYSEEELSSLKLREKLQATISFLYSPFEKSDITHNEEFNISLFYNSYKINSNFQTESINIAETIHSFNLGPNQNKHMVFQADLTLRPWYLERTHMNAIDKIFHSEKIKNHEFYRSLLAKYLDKFERNLRETRSEVEFVDEFLKAMKQRQVVVSQDVIENINKMLPIEGKIYSFKRDRNLFKMAVDSALEAEMIENSTTIENIREFLNFHNGVKLYRGPFRIANLGDKDSDWLHLQQERTRGQQFFRFELGNIIGYVKINDFFQDYIQEITSRQDTEDNKYKQALEHFLHYTINKIFYDFNARAYNLTIDIFRENDLLRVDPIQDIKKEKDRIQLLIENAKKSLSSFNHSIKTITSNIELNTPEKISIIQKEINTLQESANTFNLTINTTVESLTTTEELLEKAEKSRHDIKADAFNHFKLMANGLVTETLTHELHSMINNKSYSAANKHINELRSYLDKQNAIDIYKSSLKPLNDIFLEVETNMSNLNRFHELLEKTFIKKKDDDIYEYTMIFKFIETLKFHFDQRLMRHKVHLDFSTTNNMTWALPKGALLHILHNLIDNSIYWIDQRRKRAISSDQDYHLVGNDCITIEKYSPYQIRYYDTGTGVLSHMQDRVFHFLESGKPTNGRGMGMYIVKELLQSFGGDIKLLDDLNTYGNRYIFEITIPEDNIIDNKDS